MRMYAVKDTVCDEFGPVFEQKNDQSACRAFRAQVVNLPYCNDMELYFIGEFDNSSGKIFISDNNPRIVDQGKNYEEDYKKLHPVQVKVIKVPEEKVNE